MREGLEEWRRIQENSPAPEKGSLEEDVLAVRNLILKQARGFLRWGCRTERHI
jgi:hypothetical protein